MRCSSILLILLVAPMATAQGPVCQVDLSSLPQWMCLAVGGGAPVARQTGIIEAPAGPAEIRLLWVTPEGTLEYRSSVTLPSGSLSVRELVPRLDLFRPTTEWPEFTVGGEDGQFATLEEALKAAKPFTRIRLRPGEYRGEFVLDRPMQIVGDGPHGSVTVVSPKGAPLRIRSAGVAVEGVRVRGEFERDDSMPGISVEAGPSLIMGADVVCRSGPGIFAYRDASVLVVESAVTDCGTSGMVANRRAFVEAFRCMFRRNKSCGAHVSGATLRLRHCLLEGNGSGVQASRESSLRLDTCVVRSNRTGVGVFSGARALLLCTRVLSSRGSGVIAKGAEISIAGGRIENAFCGVALSEGTVGWLQACRVLGTRGEGVSAAASLLEVERSLVADFALWGIRVSSAATAIVSQSRITGGDAGIRADSGGICRATEVDLRGNESAWDEDGGTVELRRCQEDAK